MTDDMNVLKALIIFLAEVGTLDLPDECSDSIVTRCENLCSDISQCSPKEKERFRNEVEKLIQSPEMSDETTTFLRDIMVPIFDTD